MKKLAIIILFFFSQIAIAQRIKENKIDEFTKDTIKSTAWANIQMGFLENTNVKIRKINSYYLLDLNYVGPSIIAINKDNMLMLKMADSTIIELKPIDYAISKFNGKVCYILQTYSMTNNDISLLLNSKVEKIRINTTEGYIDKKVGKEKKSLISKHLQLIIKTPTKK